MSPLDCGSDGLKSSKQSPTRRRRERGGRDLIAARRGRASCQSAPAGSRTRRRRIAAHTVLNTGGTPPPPSPLPLARPSTSPPIPQAVLTARARLQAALSATGAGGLALGVA